MGLAFLTVAVRFVPLVSLGGLHSRRCAFTRCGARSMATPAMDEQSVKAPIDETSTVLVIGASRGLGLEFTAQCLQKGSTVFATHRGAEHGDEVPSALTAVGSWYEGEARLHPIRLDVSSDASIASAVDEIRKIAGTERPLTHVIHNAGIYGPRGSFGTVKAEDMLTTFTINSVGVVLVAQHVAKLLKPPAEGPVPSSKLPVYAIMSSKMGSVDDNTSGGSYSYRMSKAAVNIASKSLWHDLQGTAAVGLLHPGYVRTDMTGGAGLIDVQTSVEGLLRAIEATDATCPFRWVDYAGKLVPF